MNIDSKALSDYILSSPSEYISLGFKYAIEKNSLNHILSAISRDQDILMIGSASGLFAYICAIKNEFGTIVQFEEDREAIIETKAHLEARKHNNNNLHSFHVQIDSAINDLISANRLFRHCIICIDQSRINGILPLICQVLDPIGNAFFVKCKFEDISSSNIGFKINMHKIEKDVIEVGFEKLRI